VRAVFQIGPWVPGFLLPVAVGVVGVAATLLVARGGLVPVGLVLAVVAAVRVRSAAPWLLVATLVLGQLLRDPAPLDAELPVLVLAVQLIVILTQRARVVPIRARVAMAALGPAARSIVLVQLPAQLIAAVLLASAGRLQVLPVASTIGGALLVLVAGLLIAARRGEREE
jgi:hypothetical protein